MPRWTTWTLLAVALAAPTAGALGLPLGALDLPAPAATLPRELPLEATAAPESLGVEADGARVALEAPALDALPDAAPLPASAPLALAPRAPSLAPAPPVAPSTPTAHAAAGATLLAFAFALYSRLAPSQLLEHERRERVLALVRERPGIGPQAIADALGTGWGVTSYHLDKLERAGLLVSQRSGHHRCYFMPGAVPREEQKAHTMFRVDTTRRVAKLVAERPGLTQTQVAQALGISASAMSKQVSRLEAAALVRRERGEDGARLYPAPTLAHALA